MAIKAESAWGEGMDIIVSLNGTSVVLHESPKDLTRWTHGLVTKGSLEFTRDEAEAFAAQLLEAVRITDELEEGWIALHRKE